jgi:glycosidase
MWAFNTTFYQIYTLAFCGAPKENPFDPQHNPAESEPQANPRILKILDWIPQLKKLNMSAVYFCPLFSSDKHGYDTRDYRRLDERLGTNAHFAQVCSVLHQNGIKIVLDGVFNHAGRGFWAFRDVLQKREASPYKDWFYIDFWRNNDHGDGLSYECWEGHSSLVKLNHNNDALCAYLFDSIAFWIHEFDIDGLRLDVAYCLPEHFLRRLRAFCDSHKHDFFLLGEIIHGDYNRLLRATPNGTTGSQPGQNHRALHSVTNYQTHKGMWSSFNDMNMFEISYTLEQHFTNQYKGSHLLNFLDNHDVDRIASRLKNPAHIKLAYALMFAAPGIPCVYYGSEWGAQGFKGRYDDNDIRPYFSQPHETELTPYIAHLASLFSAHAALNSGTYKKLYTANAQLVFEREYNGERVIAAINADTKKVFPPYHPGVNEAKDLISGYTWYFHDRIELPPLSAVYWHIPRV